VSRHRLSCVLGATGAHGGMRCEQAAYAWPQHTKNGDENGGRMSLTGVFRAVPVNATGVARWGFAFASASIAVWIVVFGQWVPQPLPPAVPLHGMLTYAAAAVILLASIGLCLARTAVAGVLTLAAYQTVSAALAVPQWLAKPLNVDAWYPFCEAMTPLAAAVALYAMLRHSWPRLERMRGERVVLRSAQVVFGLTCVFYGLSHFTYAAYTASLVPAWLPDRLLLAYVTGGCHVAAGLAIILGIVPRLAAALEAAMMSLFGLAVWVPSFFAYPRPSWATPPSQQWSELVVTFLLAVAAWVVMLSFRESRGAAKRDTNRALSPYRQSIARDAHLGN